MIRGRRRAAAVLLAFVLVATGCRTSEGDSDAGLLEGPISTRSPETSEVAAADESTALSADTGPWTLTSEPLANAAGPPRMLVSDGDVITRIDRGVAVEVADPERRIGLAAGAGDGVVVYEELETDEDGVDTSVRLIRLAPDGTAAAVPIGAHRSVELHDIVRFGAGIGLVFTRFRDPSDVDDEVTGVLLFQDLATGERRQLAEAAGPEFFVSHASGSRDGVAFTAVADLTEVVRFVGWDGTPVERPGPTDDLAYGQPPFVTSAILSPDGTEIASVEGPEVGGDDGSLIGEWQVVVDDADGEQLRLTVADTTLASVEIDFDGRWLLVSGLGVDGPVAPLLIDTEATDLATYLVDGVVGTAQLESAAALATAD